MTKHIKDPIKFLRETGLLFEINRQVLHPFGLAMGVQPEGDPEDAVGKICLFDSRDDEEGFVYSPDTYVEALARLNNFLEEFGIEKLEERKETLGFVVQGYPDPHMKKNGVTLFTYNPNHNPDDEESPNTVVFKVPYAWLKKEMTLWHDLDIEDFLTEYTYDDTEHLYAEALQEKVIIEKDFIKE